MKEQCPLTCNTCSEVPTDGATASIIETTAPVTSPRPHAPLAVLERNIVGTGTPFSVSGFQKQPDGTYCGNSTAQLGENIIQINLGNRIARAVIESQSSAAAESLHAVVINEKIYHDDAVVRVSVQAKDNRHNAPSQWRSVSVVAAPSAALVALEHRPVYARCNDAAKGTPGMGICVVSIRLGPRKAWFDSFETGALTLKYGFTGTPEATWSQL